MIATKSCKINPNQAGGPTGRMAALQIQLDIKRLEEALRPGFAQRGALNKASFPAWDACASSVLDAYSIWVDSIFIDPAGGPKWMQWRKSNASKLLLGLLRAAIEAIASAPDWMPVDGSADSMLVKAGMASAARCAMRLMGSMPVAFWPALAEWLREQGGAAALWRVLAWVLQEKRDGAVVTPKPSGALHSVVSVLEVTSTSGPPGGRNQRLKPDPNMVACLKQLFSSLLPAVIAAEETFSVNGPIIKDLLSRMQNRVAEACLANDKLRDQMLPLVLSVWPHVASALRRRPEAKGVLQILLGWMVPFTTISNAAQHKMYYFRHLACALDMMELLAPAAFTIENCPEVVIFSSALQCLVIQPDGGMHSGLRLHRSLWGLAVRCEQSLRAVAPYWGAMQDAGLGGPMDHLYDDRPRAWLDELCHHHGVALMQPVRDEARQRLRAGSSSSGAPDWPSERAMLPLLQLLACHMATAAKFVRRDGRFCRTLESHAASLTELTLQLSSSRPLVLAAVAPSLVAFLVPRCAAVSGVMLDDEEGQLLAITALCSVSFVYACPILGLRLLLQVLSSGHMSMLLDRAVAEVRQPQQCPAWLFLHSEAVCSLVGHVQCVAMIVHHIVSQGCEGAPPGSPQLYDLLSQPILLLLLDSPLLDLLVDLQHVMVKADGGITKERMVPLLRLGPINPAHLLPLIISPSDFIPQGTCLAVALHSLLDAMLALLAPVPAELSIPAHDEGRVPNGAPVPAELSIPAHDEGRVPNGTLAPKPSDFPAQASSQVSAFPLHHLQAMAAANFNCRLPQEALTSIVDGCVELDRAIGDDYDNYCWSGLPSVTDVPTEWQAAARESAAEVLQSLRQLAGLVWPDHPAATAAAAEAAHGNSGSSANAASSYADWELLQDEMSASSGGSLVLQGQPAAVAAHVGAAEGPPPSPSQLPSPSWGEALWCFNPACTNLAGPSELALKTRPCGGGCGVRYCSPECQAQGWRDGHRLSCGRLRDRRAARLEV